MLTVISMLLSYIFILLCYWKLARGAYGKDVCFLRDSIEGVRLGCDIGRTARLEIVGRRNSLYDFRVRVSWWLDYLFISAVNFLKLF